MTTTILCLSLVLVGTCVCLCRCTPGKKVLHLSVILRLTFTMSNLGKNTNTNTVQHAMVHNPIYDGPVYESVLHSHFDALALATTNVSNSQQTPELDYRETSESPPADRYVEQPLNQSQNVLGSESLSTGASDIEDKYTVMSPAACTVDAEKD